MPLLPMPSPGDVFGGLTVLFQQPDETTKRGWRKVVFLCRCQCGVEKSISSDSLRSGRSNSCGCVRDAQTGARSTTHGHGKAPVYAVWNMMLQRCLLPSNPNYVNYGGRGITVCERWKTFENFLADMGTPPTPGATLERTNNDLGYSPENCVWADRKTQSRNKRNNRLFEFRGQSKLLPDWAAELGICKATLASRIYMYQWTVEQAFTTPVRGKA